jgi:hypothetical protein
MAPTQIQEVVVVEDHFETEDGQLFQIHGIQHENSWYRGGGNLGNRAKSFYDLGSAAWFNAWDAGTLAASGINCLRLGISDLSDSEIARMQALIRACSRFGIYVIPVMTMGSWTDDAIASWAADWGQVATLTSRVNGVLGYDIVNEPYAPSDSVYIQACNAAKDAIRAHSDKPIFYAWPFGGIHMPDVSATNTSADIYDPYACLTAHFYYRTEFTHHRAEWSYPGNWGGQYADKAYLANSMESHWRRYINDHPLALWIGECGAVRHADGYLAWVGDTKANIEENWGGNWSYFRYKHRNRGNNWGIALPEDFASTDAILRPLVDDQQHTFTAGDFEFMKTSHFWLDTLLLDVLNEGGTQ